MRKSAATILALGAAVAAIAAPVVLAIDQAERQALDAESSHVLAYARDVLHRSDSTAEQINAAIIVLTSDSSRDPCSIRQIQRMRQLDLSSSYIQALGYVRGDSLVCSSLARVGGSLLLGRPDLVTPAKASFRTDVELPFAPGMKFLVVEKYGYAAIIHKSLPIDVTTDESDASLGTFSSIDWRILASRGEIRPQWISRARTATQSTFIDGGRIVAVLRSSRYNIGAIASVPANYVSQRTRKLAELLVPIGVVAGVALALALLYMARLQLALPAVLKSALRRNEFSVVYQPVVDLATGRWVGAEALIRWRRPTGEMVRPDLFIKVAEDTGLIERITQRMIDLVTPNVSELFRRHPDFHVGINLSKADLQSRATVERLRRLVRETAARPANILVEATERGFIDPDLARDVVHDIRSLGIKVAIDDFGTGFSSLSQLQSLELDYLKIDKTFVDTMGTDAATSQVAVHIIEMAKDLKLEMIAEGVESEAQARILVRSGIRYAQGWYFGRPMSFAELLQHLEEQSAAARAGSTGFGHLSVVGLAGATS